MTPTAWLLLGAMLVLDTGSHLLLKASTARAHRSSHGQFLLALFSDPLFWLTVVAFLGVLVAWVGFYSVVPLAQGVMAGCITIAGVMIGGRIFFRERITPARAMAVGLIIVGVLLVGWDKA
jgi:multidrug transporter EmrE-like cation transporter